MTSAQAATAFRHIFGKQEHAQLAGSLKHYLSDILLDSRVEEETALDIRKKCQEPKAEPYEQAKRFLDVLNSGALSPQAINAVRSALLDAKAGHLLNGGVGKPSATATAFVLILRHSCAGSGSVRIDVSNDRSIA